MDTEHGQHPPEAQREKKESPPLSYQWKSLETFPEETQIEFKKAYESQHPGLKPEEILFPSGRSDEQEIIGLALDASMLRIQNSRREFPNIRNRAVISIDQVNLLEDEQKHLGYMFLSLKEADVEQYRIARAILLEEVNANLQKIKKPIIPPPAAK